MREKRKILKKKERKKREGGRDGERRMGRKRGCFQFTSRISVKMT